MSHLRVRVYEHDVPIRNMKDEKYLLNILSHEILQTGLADMNIDDWPYVIGDMLEATNELPMKRVALVSEDLFTGLTNIFFFFNGRYGVYQATNEIEEDWFSVLDLTLGYVARGTPSDLKPSQRPTANFLNMIVASR